MVDFCRLKQDEIATCHGPPAVEAHESCAQFTGYGAIADQPGFAPITRRALLTAINSAAKDLGIRPTTLLVLDALLSCLPCRDQQTGKETPITPLTLLTVYASNATLSFRAKGLTDRQLRRHLEQLEDKGLIRRRDSANGKRFPIRFGARIIGAFGIDLTPLLTRAAEIRTIATTAQERAETLRSLKAQIHQLRAKCLCKTLASTDAEFIDGLRNILRRTSTTISEAQAIIKRLTGLLRPASRKTPATDGQNVRHIDSPKTDTKKRATSVDIQWAQLTTLHQFFPDAPVSEKSGLRIVEDFGHMLGITPTLLKAGLGRLGLWPLLQLQDQMARHIHDITHPDAYFRARLNSVGHGQLRTLELDHVTV